MDFALPPARRPRPIWPQPGGNPDHSVEHAAAAADFDIAWKRKIGDSRGRGHYIPATPVIADGKIFTLDSAGLVTRLTMRADRREQVWRNDLAAHPRPRPRRLRRRPGLCRRGDLLLVGLPLHHRARRQDRRGEVAHGRPFADARARPPWPTGRGVRGQRHRRPALRHRASPDRGSIVWNYQALVEESGPGDRRLQPGGLGRGAGRPLRLRRGQRLPHGQRHPAVGPDTLLFTTNRNNACSEDPGDTSSGRPVVYRGDVFAGSHSGMFGATSLREGGRRWDLPIATITTPLPTGDVVYVTDQAGQLICRPLRESGQVFLGPSTSTRGSRRPRTRRSGRGRCSPRTGCCCCRAAASWPRSTPRPGSGSRASRSGKLEAISSTRSHAGDGLCDQLSEGNAVDRDPASTPRPHAAASAIPLPHKEEGQGGGSPSAGSGVGLGAVRPLSREILRRPDHAGDPWSTGKDFSR